MVEFAVGNQLNHRLIEDLFAAFQREPLQFRDNPVLYKMLDKFIGDLRVA